MHDAPKETNLLMLIQDRLQMFGQLAETHIIFVCLAHIGGIPAREFGMMITNLVLIYGGGDGSGDGVRKTLPKAQRARGLSSSCQSNLASESRPRFFFINSTKHQRQNAEQTPASKSCLNFDFNPWA